MNYNKIYVHTLLLTSFFLLMISCNTETKNENVNIEVEKNLNIVKPDVEKTNIFLTYFTGMSYSEFSKASKLLTSQGILEGERPDLYYLTNDCRTFLEPEFIDGKLVEISLMGVNCIYPIYAQKYNLPNIIEKQLVEQYVEK